MAFIKTYFLKYFIAGILTNSIGNTSKINIYVNRARKSLIKILPPDINESSNKFYAGKDGIRCPLSIINGVGTSISNDIISERRLFLVLYMQEQLILNIIKILLYKI